MTPLAQARIAIASAAGDPQALFGYTGYDRRRTYRRLSNALHPDRYESASDDDKADAADLFVQVQQLWKELTDAAANRFTIGTYTASGMPIKGDLANLYSVDGERNLLLKVARLSGNNDLLQREAGALKAIAKLGSRRAVFISTLVESFRYRDAATHVDRRVNVIETLDDYVSLQRLAEAFPDGLDIRDLVWIWRRVLVGLSLAHQAGYVHGAVLPQHIMVHLARHEVVLVDWCYSAKIGEKVPAMVKSCADLYAPEILAKQAVTPATDIYMLAMTMATLYDNRVPRQFHAFVKACTQKQDKRPGDAARLLREVTDLIERLYGKRKFRVLVLP